MFDVAFVLCVLGGDPVDDNPLEYSFRLAPAYRRLGGSVQVRENLVSGDRLQLGSEVGLDQAVGANVQFEIDTKQICFVTEVEELFGFGGRSSTADFAWNGTVYHAPSQVRAHASFLTMRNDVSFKLAGDPSTGAWVGPLVGLEWPYYTMSIGTNRQHGSIEEWTHYLPFPIVGASGNLPLGDAWSLQPRFCAGYLPNIASPFTEGGRLYVSVRPTATLEVPLVWRVSSSVDLVLTATRQYWHGGDHSDEDDNRLWMWSAGVMVGVGFRW